MKKLAALTALVTLTLIWTFPAFPQSSEELKALKKDLEAIQKELREIKTLLQARPAAPVPPAPAQPQNVVLSVEGAPFKGEKSAKVTLIEFSDYQCPFCARHYRQTLPQIEKDYIQTGKVRYVLRDFPIASLHPQAAKGHEAAHCAGEEGKYWEMHARLFANQRAMAPKDLSEHAQALNLDMAKFQQCLDSEKYAARVRKDLADAQTAGVAGTPTFFLGLTEPDGSQVKALRSIRGAQPYAAFKEAIESLLSQKQ